MFLYIPKKKPVPKRGDIISTRGNVTYVRFKVEPRRFIKGSSEKCVRVNPDKDDTDKPT